LNITSGRRWSNMLFRFPREQASLAALIDKA
jgi:hypothetical protein